MKHTEENLKRGFSSKKEKLGQWGKICENRIFEIAKETLGGEYEIKIKPTFRVKDETSFIFKVLYRGNNYENIDPFIEIWDKVGARIVLLSTTAVLKVAKAINEDRYWKASKTRDFKEDAMKSPQTFDYQSMHIVVQPKFGIDYFLGKKKITFSKAEIKYLTCELQIRTLLQHAFAEISHDTTYKGPYRHDITIMRELSKTMALMEATDDYFVNVENLMSSPKRKYSNFYTHLRKLMIVSLGIKETDVLTDSVFADHILGLLKHKDVSTNDIDRFVEIDIHFKEAIQSRDLITKEPAFLLAAYYFINNPTWLKSAWTLSSDSYNQCSRLLGMTGND